MCFTNWTWFLWPSCAPNSAAAQLDPSSLVLFRQFGQASRLVLHSRPLDSVVRLLLVVNEQPAPFQQREEREAEEEHKSENGIVPVAALPPWHVPALCLLRRQRVGCKRRTDPQAPPLCDDGLSATAVCVTALGANHCREPGCAHSLP